MTEDHHDAEIHHIFRGSNPDLTLCELPCYQEPFLAASGIAAYGWLKNLKDEINWCERCVKEAGDV